MDNVKVLFYTTPQHQVKIDVRLQDETLWLTQKQMAELFGVNVPAISKHLKNIFESGELLPEATISKIETYREKRVKADFLQMHLWNCYISQQTNRCYNRQKQKRR